MLGEGLKRGSHSSSRSGSRRSRGYSIGLGRSQSDGASEEDVLLPNSRLHFYRTQYFKQHIDIFIQCQLINVQLKS